MKFADHLSRDQIQKFNQLRRKQKAEEEPVNPVKKKEKLFRREWEEIMGKNRDTFKRVKGAVRRR